MYSLFVNVEYTDFAVMFEHTTGKTIGKRVFANMLAHANRQMAIYWHTNILPLHFNAEQRRYSNQRRKTPYSKIKRDLASGGRALNNGYVIRERTPVVRGGVIDNVRKGHTERQARSSPGIFASKTRSTVTMFVPRYAAIKSRDGSKPDKASEITAVAPQEYPLLRRVFIRTLVHMIRIHRDRILKRI